MSRVDGLQMPVRINGQEAYVSWPSSAPIDAAIAAINLASLAFAVKTSPIATGLGFFIENSEVSILTSANPTIALVDELARRRSLIEAIVPSAFCLGLLYADAAGHTNRLGSLIATCCAFVSAAQLRYGINSYLSARVVFKPENEIFQKPEAKQVKICQNIEAAADEEGTATLAEENDLLATSLQNDDGVEGCICDAVNTDIVGDIALDKADEAQEVVAPTADEAQEVEAAESESTKQGEEMTLEEFVELLNAMFKSEREKVEAKQ